MNAIELNHVAKRYGDFALEDVNLNLPQGCVLGLIGEVKRTWPVCASRRKSVSLSAASASVCCRESDHFARSYVFAGNRTASSPTSSASGTASSRASRLPSLSCRARSSWLSSSSARTPTTSRIAQAAGGVCKMTRHKTSTGSTPASR